MTESETAVGVPPARPHVVKLVVHLSVKTMDALGECAFTSDASANDVVNHAIRAYAFLVERMEAGAEVILRDRDGREQVVRFLA